MKIRSIIFTVLCLALAVSASAATFVPTPSELPAGWAVTVAPDSGGRGSVTNRLWGTEDVFQFMNGNKDVTSRCWAAISTDNYANTRLADILAMEIRLYGIEGDGTGWQAPQFIFGCKKEENNLSFRPLYWVPWSDGTAREPGVWKTYNPMVDGSWFCPWIGATYSSMAAVVAAYPDVRFASAAEIATMLPGGGFKGRGFNLGYGDSMNEANAYGDSARGVVDWFSMCRTGCDAECYYLGAVPEPGSLLALATGLIGFIGLRKRF